MSELQIVNDKGYKALLSLAQRNPGLFTATPDPQRLKDALIKEAGPPDVWREGRQLEADLQPLNDLQEPGPSTDAEHSRTLRSALREITPRQASDELFWASVNCFALAQYVPVRWQTSNTRTAKPTNFVMDHWLLHRSEGRKRNAAARLWWLGELAGRASRYSKHSEDKLLTSLAGNVQFYHQTVDRTYLAANPRLLAAICDVFLEGNDHLNTTKAANEMLKALNIQAGAMSFDMMSLDELRETVRKAVPPKKGSRLIAGNSKHFPPPALRVLSLGGGVQSTVLCLMAEQGAFQSKPDCAIFADTGWEPDSVYENIEWLETQLSFPIHKVSNGRSLYDDVANGVNAQGHPWLTLPVYLSDAEGTSTGINWRQCTKNYKLDPIRKTVQGLLGVNPRQSLSPETSVEMWLGITTDESTRIKPSRNWWIRHRYPLVDDLPMDRDQCREWFEERYPDRKLSRSACIGCPFRSSASWVEIMKNEPQKFAETIQLDRMIRSPEHNAGRMFRKRAYLHHRRIPLEEAVSLDLEEMSESDQFGNECEGHCGL